MIRRLLSGFPSPRMAVPAARHILSLCLSKDGDARFLGRLDFGRLVDRSLRRSGLPVQYTQGFNPRFKVSFADALPVGVASAGEWITVQIDEDLDPDDVAARLAPALPEGVRLVDVRRGGAPEPPDRAPWHLAVVRGEGSAADALTALLERDEYPLEEPRSGRLLDVRALLSGGQCVEDGLLVELAVVDGRPPRPGPVIAALRELAAEMGQEPPVFGVLTKQAAVERRPGDEPWHDAAGTPRGASSSSTPSSPRRAASPSSRAAAWTSTT